MQTQSHFYGSIHHLLQPTFLETIQMRLNNSFGLKMWTLGDEVQQISLYNEPLTFDKTQKRAIHFIFMFKGFISQHKKVYLKLPSVYIISKTSHTVSFLTAA